MNTPSRFVVALMLCLVFVRPSSAASQVNNDTKAALELGRKLLPDFMKTCGTEVDVLVKMGFPKDTGDGTITIALAGLSGTPQRMIPSLMAQAQSAQPKELGNMLACMVRFISAKDTTNSPKKPTNGPTFLLGDGKIAEGNGAPAAKTADLYWIGIELKTKGFVCEFYYCKMVPLKMHMFVDDLYGTRLLAGAIKGIDYIVIGPPMPEGMTYRVVMDDPTPEGLYKCVFEGGSDSGVVPAVPSSRNADLANRLIKIVCEPTQKLRDEAENARLDREQRDSRDPNLDDLLTGCPAELEAAIADRMARGESREVATAYFTGSAEGLLDSRDPIILRRLLGRAATESAPPSLNRLQRCMLTRRLAQLGALVAPPPAMVVPPAAVVPPAVVVPPAGPPAVHIPLAAVSPLLGSCSAQLDAAVNQGIAEGKTRAALVADFESTAGALASLTSSLLLPGMLAAEARIGGVENRLNSCMMKRRLAELDASGPVPPVQVPPVEMPRLPTPSPTTIVPAPPPASRPTAPATPARPPAGSSASTIPPPRLPATVPPPQDRVTPPKPAERHHPEHEATSCVRLIDRKDFAANGVKSIMGAVLRNSCAFPIEVVWCVDCHPGYDNLSSVRALADGPISVPTNRHYDVKWAACQAGAELGFNSYQSRISSELKYSCR
jgi:hypothetical protein